MQHYILYAQRPLSWVDELHALLLPDARVKIFLWNLRRRRQTQNSNLSKNSSCETLYIQNYTVFVCQIKWISTLYPTNRAFAMSVFFVFNRMSTWAAFFFLAIVGENYGFRAGFHVCTAVCAMCLFVNIVFVIILRAGNKSSFLQDNGEEIEKEKQSLLAKESQSDTDEISLQSAKRGVEVQEKIQNQEKEEKEGKEGFFEGLKYCVRSLPVWLIVLVSFSFYSSLLSFASLAPVFIRFIFSLLFIFFLSTFFFAKNDSVPITTFLRKKRALFFHCSQLGPSSLLHLWDGSVTILVTETFSWGLRFFVV